MFLRMVLRMVKVCGTFGKTSAVATPNFQRMEFTWASATACTEGKGATQALGTSWGLERGQIEVKTCQESFYSFIFWFHIVYWFASGGNPKKAHDV